MDIKVEVSKTELIIFVMIEIYCYEQLLILCSCFSCNFMVIAVVIACEFHFVLCLKYCVYDAYRILLLFLL